MSRFSARFFGRERSNESGRGVGKPREARRFAPRAEPLEGRIAPAGNIVITGVSAVDSKDNPLASSTDPQAPPIYAGDVFYIRADWTTVGLPNNASYQVRYDSNTIEYYSPPLNYGAVGFHLLQQWYYFQGPFLAKGGPQTITAFINPKRTVNESNFNDNYLENTINAIDSPTKLVFRSPTEQPPTSVTAGVNFGLTVAVEDQYGNVVLNDQGPVTVSLTTNPGGDTLGGTLIVAATNGLATFANLHLKVADAGYTLALSRSGLAGVPTNPVTIVPAYASQLAITQQQVGNVAAGQDIALDVAIEDAYGNLETGDFKTSVTATLAGGAGPLLGQDVITAVGGISTFGNLLDDKAETMSLKFGAPNLAGMTSKNIVVTPATASQLILQGQPSSTGTVGRPFATQPAIEEEDQFGNLETTDNRTVVTATLASGVGPLQGATAMVSGGVATFQNLADGKAETMSLRFGSANLAIATSGNVVVGKATPTINWVPKALASGTPLGAAQFDATASNYGSTVPGSFSYSSPAGTVLPLGPHQLTVTFMPTDASDYTTATGTATINVLAPSTTSLTASAAKATYKQPITFNATVATPLGGATPTGTVTFLDGTRVLGSSPLDGAGHATFSATSLPSGSPSITATYSGDSTYGPSTSPATALKVREPSFGDFDGDGRADVAIYDQTSSSFHIVDSNGGSLDLPFGNSGHVNIPISGDFDGDGKADLAIYDQTASEFIIKESGGGSILRTFGNPKDVNIPVSGDFDGDGKADLGIYDQTASAFIVLESGGGSIIRGFGNPNDVNFPVSGDFDGDGKADVGIYDQTASEFIILESGGGAIIRGFGNPRDVNIPVSGDFDGDGKADIGVYDQTSSQFIVQESGGGAIIRGFGNSADMNIPVSGDFDGDGKADIGVYDQTSSQFIVQESGGGSIFLPVGTKKHANIPV